ncbi:MAG TPA: sulfite exporter TauE/SafE family protein [Streptosporangiaceae bacterium]
MPPAEALAIFAAAVAAGGINAVVGSGSLITFPTLLAFGFPAVIANVSNNVGLVFGNITGSVGYRSELAGQRAVLLRLCVASMAGSLAGAILLLSLPPSAFTLIVPVLILLSCALVIVQPRLNAWLARRRAATGEEGGAGQQSTGGEQRPGPVLPAGIALAGAYGGYFGAAQGVLVIGLLGSFLHADLQRANAGKNVLVAVVNGTAAVVFIFFAHVNWVVAGLIAVGSAAGGVLGARVGRKLPPLALRIIIVVIGLVAAAKLVFFG